MEFKLNSYGCIDPARIPKPEDLTTEELSFVLSHYPPAMANAWGQVSEHGRSAYQTEFNKRYAHLYKEDEDEVVS